MRLSERSEINRNIAAQVYGLICLIITLFAFDQKVYSLILIPVFVTGAAVIIFFPQTIIYLFFLSFFWGGFLFSKGPIVVIVTDIIILLLILAYFSQYYREKIGFGTLRLNRRVLFPLLILFAWSTASFVLNVHRHTAAFQITSLWYVFKFIQLLIVFVVFSDLRCPVNQETVINLSLGMFLLQLPVALYQYFSVINMDFEIGRGQINGTLSYHHAMLGTFLLFGLAFCYYRFKTSQTLKQKLLYILIAFACLFTLLLTGARSPLVGLCCLLVYYVLTKFRFKASHIVWFSCAAILITLLIMFSPLRRTIEVTFFSKNIPTTVDISSLSRIYMWKRIFAHFAASSVFYKLFGVGIGTTPTINLNILTWSGLKNVAGAHNNFLHILVETGIVGLIAFIILFLSILRELHKKIKRSPLASSFFLLTVALLGTAFTQETFWFQKSLQTVWLFYMVFVAVLLRETGNAPNGNDKTTDMGYA